MNKWTLENLIKEGYVIKRYNTYYRTDKSLNIEYQKYYKEYSKELGCEDERTLWYCLFHNIDKLPICPICGEKIILRDKRKNFPICCSTKCTNNYIYKKGSKTKEKIYGSATYNNPKKSNETKRQNPEKQKEALQKFRNSISKRTKEQKIQSRYKALNTYAQTHNISVEEAKEEWKRSLSNAANARTPEEWKKMNDKINESKRNRTEEQKQASIQKHKETAARNITEFEQNNNCIEIIKLIQKYGQNWIALCLPRIKDNKNRVYINNQYLNQIEEYSKHKHAGFSHQEKQVLDYIKSIYKGQIIENTKKILPNNLELDIYIPEYNIGIEYNGNYWHSLLKRDYHFEKSKACEKIHIRLIHIYEYEWLDPEKQAKIKEMLEIALHYNKLTKIYARNCIIKEITNIEAKPFNEKHHLQGHRYAKITYGLYYNDKLVQLMSFSKDRFSLNKLGEWEIIRGCPSSNNIVIGGVEKLFSHFIKEHNPKSIFSYSDFNKFDGNSYAKIGMNFIGYTGPNKVYIINGVGHERNPFKYKEYTEKADYVIWGSGSKKFLWENQK